MHIKRRDGVARIKVTGLNNVFLPYVSEFSWSTGSSSGFNTASQIWINENFLFFTLFQGWGLDRDITSFLGENDSESEREDGCQHMVNGLTKELGRSKASSAYYSCNCIEHLCKPLPLSSGHQSFDKHDRCNHLGLVHVFCHNLTMGEI